MRRRKDDPFGRVNADGTQDIPGDQTGDPSLDVAAGPPDPSVAPDPTMQDPSQMGGQDPTVDPGSLGQPDPTAGAQPPDAGATSMLGSMMGAGTDPGTTGQMSDADLASLDAGPTGSDAQGFMSPDDQQVQQLDQALSDPNTTPDQRAQIEQQLALAARRRLMGGQLGGLGA